MSGMDRLTDEALEGHIELLLDAQQDINLAANQHMNQALCDASALLDTTERFLRELLAHRRASQAAPAPSDGLREAARFGCDQLGMDKMPDGEWVRFTDYEELRDRAEAAKAERDAARDESLRELMALEVVEHCRAQLTAARRAEAAAWNDAIEAAARDVEEWGNSFGDLDPVQPRVVADDIRALRRAAPTEGEA